MKKSIPFWILALLTFTVAHAQREIWGSATGAGSAGSLRHGYLFKTDSEGDNLVIVHRFDSIHGRYPGELTLGSNGKLYGCTVRGGPGQYQVPNAPAGQQTDGGTLFEYDPVLDSLRVLYSFDRANPGFPYDGPMEYRLLEYSPGVFYGTLQSPGRVIFKYTPGTNTISLVATVPNFIGGSMGSVYSNYVNGRLTKAADGNIYAASTHNSSCPMGNPGAGTLLRLNPGTNVLTTVYLNPCHATDGMNYSAPGLEYGGKLYGVALGGNYGAGTTYLYPGYGVVYEFNPANNAYAKKADFLGVAGGKSPHPVLLETGGKFYGTADGGTPYQDIYGFNHPAGSGTIFEFNPVDNTLRTVHEFRSNQSVYDEGEYGRFSLKGSNGKLYGLSTNGIFSYDPLTQNIGIKGRISNFHGPRNLTEICRKPGYTYNAVTQYTVCAGADFRYDLHNDNATTVSWTHDGSPAPQQTSSVLSFNGITAADAGTWICTLTNACGSTVTPAIQITVNPAGPGTLTSVLSPAGPLSICPGSSVTLTGNNGGTWNTGAVTPTLTVTRPGEYRVTNTNACGQTYSNTVRVDTIPAPPVPVAVIGSFNGCPGSNVTFSGNTGGGVWNTGSNSPTLTVPAVPNVRYYIVNTHTCGTDTSNKVWLYPNSFTDTSGAPHINTIGPPVFCDGGSVTLVANTGVNDDAFWTWRKFAPNGAPQGAFLANQPIVATESGIYVLSMSLGICGIERTDTVRVIEETYPQTPVITALGTTTVCAGDTVVLQSNLPAGGRWNTGQTGQQFHVTQSGTYSQANTNSCGSETSNPITVQVLPAPTVSYTAPVNEFCSTGGNTLLTGGTPVGGTYSGTGVNGGNYFAPWIAGTGVHTLTYTYSDGTCSAHATQQVRVIEPQPAVLLSNRAGNRFCEGGTLLLFQTQFQSVTWSTGDEGVVLFVNQPGTYSYTVTNACGTVTSNSITAVSVPASPPTYNPQTICAGETYVFNGHTYSATGTYTDNLVNIDGCDSSIITQLTVTTAPSSLNPQTVCAGRSYSFNGHTYNVAGDYTDTFQTAAGCDSLVITRLTVTPAPETDNPQTVCAGQTYTVNGHVYSSSGTYIDTLQTPGACDSIVTTRLSVLPAAGSNNPQSICRGESYVFNGHTYTTPGTYTDLFQTAAGCDSIVSTTLVVHELELGVTQNGRQLSALQTGAVYRWINCATQTPVPGATGQTFSTTADGQYAVIISANGCSDTSACYTISSVSIEEWETGPGLTLYPNPATDVVWIKTDAVIIRVSVYNSLGQCVYSTQNNQRIDMAGLAPGSYFVSVETETGIFRGKVLKY